MNESKIYKYKTITIVFLLGMFSFILRYIYADTINNNIHDLSARYVLVCFDILQGKYHFPHHPWIMEYDEAAFSWLLVPWVLIAGRSWEAFRLFGAILASLAPPVLYLVTSKVFNQATGIIAGVLLASIPAQLVWDRYLFMSPAAVLMALWLTSLYLCIPKTHTRLHHFVTCGCLLGVATYFAHYSLAMPAVVAIILLDNKKLKIRLFRLLAMLSAFILITMPLIVLLIKNPGYILWRQRHFHEEVFTFASLPQTFIDANVYYIRSLFSGGFNCLFLGSDVAVLNIPAAVMVILGIAFLIRKGWIPVLVALGLPLAKYVMLGFIRTENWSSVYHVFSMPFLMMTASVGAAGLIESASKRFSKKKVYAFAAAVISLIVIFNIWQFFRGPYRIPPRPDILTRLQADLKHQASIPYVFSAGLYEVTHYHLPFWVATRCYQNHISIAGIDNDIWVTNPDKKKIEFVSNSESVTAFVMEQHEISIFREKLGNENILQEYTLPSSGLHVLVCSVEIPDILKRTWLDSYVPPLLPIKRD